MAKTRNLYLTPDAPERKRSDVRDELLLSRGSFGESRQRMSRSSSLTVFGSERTSAYPWLEPFIRVYSCPFAVVSSLLRPRMGLIVRFLQPFNRDMRINLRSRKALVAE
jgi:hypothetical protein